MKKKYIKIKITGGYLKNRKIIIPYNLYLRPTINRMREKLFNWLSPIVKNSHCLDCFAGSGSLGIEALSRKANNVILLEINKNTTIKIINNLKLLNINKAKVININSLKWLSENKKKFNIIFIDPPFYKNIINNTIKLIENNKYLTYKTWIYIETEKKKSDNFIIPNNWYLKYKTFTKNNTYRLYIRYKN